MKNIQIAIDPKEQKLNVYENHNKKIGELTPSDFGTAFDWNGEAVINFFLDILTDCNYHSERKAIETALQPEIDLFEHLDEQSPDLFEICDKWGEKQASEGLSYKDCETFLSEVQAIGYTFEYGLDSEPYGLHKIK